MLKIDDLRPETGKWKGSTELTIIDGQHQIISDCRLVNTPSVWVDTDHSQCLKAVFTSQKLMNEYISKFIPESKRHEWYSEALQLDPSEECD